MKGSDPRPESVMRRYRVLAALVALRAVHFPLLSSERAQPQRQRHMYYIDYVYTLLPLR